MSLSTPILKINTYGPSSIHLKNHPLFRFIDLLSYGAYILINKLPHFRRFHGAPLQYRKLIVKIEPIQFTVINSLKNFVDELTNYYRKRIIEYLNSTTDIRTRVTDKTSVDHKRLCRSEILSEFGIYNSEDYLLQENKNAQLSNSHTHWISSRHDRAPQHFGKQHSFGNSGC